MSRYSNVQLLLKVAETNNQDDLIQVMESSYANSSYEYLAEDIAFVIISLWGMVPKTKQLEFKERLTDDIVDYEMSQMFDPEEE